MSASEDIVLKPGQKITLLPENPSLRDYFAAAALTGLLTNNGLAMAGGDDIPPRFAARAYELADAMLGKRDRVEG